MSPAAWGALGAAIGPLLLFITYIASKRTNDATAAQAAAAGVVTSALSTTETMRLLLVPLEQEISELRTEIVVLRTHITSLEAQIREMGGHPIEPPSPNYPW